MCKVCRYLRSNIELTQKGNQLGLSSSVNKKAMLSQGEPRDAAVNFDTYRILYNGIVLFPTPARLSCWYVCLQSADNDNAGLLSKVSEEVAAKIANKCHRRKPHCRLTPLP